MPKRRKLKKPKFPKTEEAMWKRFNGTGHRHAIRRGVMRDKTAEMFEKGVSVKGTFLAAVRRFLGNGHEFRPNTRSRHLGEVHPSAWRYFEMYAVEYRPFAWTQQPPMGEPKRKKCFLNAMVLAYIHNEVEQEKGHKPRTKVGRTNGRHKLYNVQGIALGPLVPAMLHGWNAWGPSKAKVIDWTFYAASKWTRYFGIPLTYEETTEISKIKGPETHLVSVFSKDTFDLKIRLALTRVMHRRRQAEKKIPIRTRTVKKSWPTRGRKVRSPGIRRGSFYIQNRGVRISCF